MTPTVRRRLIEPALETLGFNRGTATAPRAEAPDYTLFPDGDHNAPVACLAYTWDRYLDGKDEMRDIRRPDENPGAKVVTVLDSGVAPWAIVTNGKLWRLYAAAAHSRATSYYEIDLEETLALPDPGETFRYFWLIFRAAAFRPRTIAIGGDRRELSFVDQLVQESADYAKRLGDRLKDRVFDRVFPELANGFIAHIRDLDGPAADLSQGRLDEVFHGTLTLLYRLLFLLYAEARDLLPAREVHGYRERSLSRLKLEIARAAGPIEEDVPRRLADAYSADPRKTELYDRLLDLARIVDRGDAAVNTPVYNGGLFLTEVEPDDHTPEREAARFLLRYKIPDRFLALALDRLARDVDEKRGDLVPIDYKSLGVRQLGSIYEGLLEFRLRLAPEKMAIVKGKKAEEIIPYREAVKEKRTILAEGRGRNAAERTLPKGAVYVENDRRERKATGSYYTPDYIVKYIVEHAVGPVLREHVERLRPKLREAQLAYREAQQRRAGFQKKGMRGDDPEKLANDERWRAVVDELFDFRVLDPAMGSGHFLVEAVDFITDQMLDFLNAFPWNPVQAQLRQTRETIMAEMERQGVNVDPNKLTDVNLLKRHVLKRCIYGVDLNPMAVELAKVSLWLHCFTLGAPLSFLDHHLKCGNSLIGGWVQEVRNAIEGKAQGFQQLSLFSQSQFTGLMLATDLMRHVGELSDVTAEEVRQSRQAYAKANDALAPFKRILDVYVSRWFGNEPVKGRGKNAPAVDKAVDFLRSQEAQRWIQNPPVTIDQTGGDGLIRDEQRMVVRAVLRATAAKRFFHWEMEFPEIFFISGRGEPGTVERRKEAGFHAVIGNPPFIDKKHITSHFPNEDAYWQTSGRFRTSRGIYDIYMLFLELSVNLCRPGARFCLLAPIPWLTQTEGQRLREFLLEAGAVHILDFSQASHFDDALVKIVGVAVEVGNSSDRVRVYTTSALRTMPIHTIRDLFDGQIRIDVPTEYLEILEKIIAHSVPLSALYTPTFGLRACSKERGGFTKQHLIRPRSECESPVRYIESEDVCDAKVNWRGRWLDYQPEDMYSPRTPEIFLGPKVIVPSLLSRRIVRAAYDEEGFFADQSLVCISSQYQLPVVPSGLRRPSLRSLQRQLNAATTSFFFAHAVVGEALGGGAIHATPGLVARLRVFTDPTIVEDCQTDVDDAIAAACAFSEADKVPIREWLRQESGLK